MKAFVRNIPVFVVALALTGCANYHMGHAVPPNLRTIAVPTFENASGTPQAEVLATQAVLAEIRRDGVLRIAERENAALEMSGRILSCTLTSLHTDHDRPYETLEYRLTLVADVKIYERATGKVVAHLGKVKGEDLFRTQSDLPSAKRDALPRAAARLAKTVVSETQMAW